MVIVIASFGANDENFKKCMEIRFKVFTEEQGVDKDIEFDGLDFDAAHYLITIDNKPVATARWRETDEGIKIERMAVIKEYRGLGIGNLLLRYMLRELIKSGKKIYLHAQKSVQRFYELNHVKPVGEPFLEANMEHIKMVYEK